jgi:hypothetical protein
MTGKLMLNKLMKKQMMLSAPEERERKLLGPRPSRYSAWREGAKMVTAGAEPSSKLASATAAS